MITEKVNTVYLLGIGGIGMSALARYFNYRGAKVSGYDLVKSTLTQQLEVEGIKIHYKDEPGLIPSGTELAIYTPAVPETNLELQHLSKSGIPLYKRSEILGMISEKHVTIAVAGTHGKTSISAMITHIMVSAGKQITAMVGGIMNNFHSNIVISDHPEYFVTEADEYDRSFLQLHPYIAVVSAIESDHLDIYGSNKSLRDGFINFTQQLADGGLLVRNENTMSFGKEDVIYGLGENCQVRAVNIKVADEKFMFDLIYHDLVISDISMLIPGQHYIENALAASAVCLRAGLSEQDIKKGLESFNGVERRFERRAIKGDRVFIDDYAHHPTEIGSTVRAVKQLYPERNITGIFQPHLYSRTKDLATAFGEELSLLDTVILLPIYPAREEPISGVTSELIKSYVSKPCLLLNNKTELFDYLANNKTDILLTMGAGDIGMMVNDIEKILNEQ